MIKPQELRIGNWLRIKESDTKVQVEVYMLNLSYLTGYQPIPLTPEILLKCEFVMHKDKGLWRKGNFYLHFYTLSENEYCFTFKDYKSASILYLHQLQNIYWCLCGEELTIKL